MRLKLFVVASLCVLIGVLSASAFPVVGLGTVGGRVVNAQGAPVAAAVVTLQASDGGELQTTQTNTQGRFWFASLPEGQYSVRASDHRLVSEWRQNVWVAPGRETDVTLHLRLSKKNIAPFG